MAKKAVATFSAKSGAKSMVKCIRMDKSSKTGAYVFKEELVEADKVLYPGLKIFSFITAIFCNFV